MCIEYILSFRPFLLFHMTVSCFKVFFLTSFRWKFDSKIRGVWKENWVRNSILSAIQSIKYFTHFRISILSPHKKGAFNVVLVKKKKTPYDPTIRLHDLTWQWFNQLNRVEYVHFIFRLVEWSAIKCKHWTVYQRKWIPFIGTQALFPVQQTQQKMFKDQSKVDGGKVEKSISKMTDGSKFGEKSESEIESKARKWTQDSLGEH